MAIENNPGLRSSHHYWQASVEKAGYSGVWPGPLFSFDYTATTSGPQAGDWARRYALKQPLPLFGTLGIDKGMAGRQADLDFFAMQSRQAELAYEVTSAFYDYYYLGREAETVAESEDLLALWESSMTAGYKTGQRTYLDLVRLQIEKSKLDNDLQGLRDKIAVASAHLAALVNLSTFDSLPLPAAMAVGDAAISFDSIMVLARQYNPVVRSRQMAVERDRQGVRKVKRSWWPTLSLEVDYTEGRPADMFGMGTKNRDSWMVGVGFEFPILIGQYHSQKAEAASMYQASLSDLAEENNALIIRLKAVHAGYLDAVRRLRLFRDDVLPKARQIISVGYASYQGGQIDFAELLTAQRDLLDFQLAYERAIIDVGLAKAEIDMLIGWPEKTPGKK